MAEKTHKNGAERHKDAPERLVKVWDLPTRLFHWTLVSMVLIGYLTGYVFAENTMGVHLWAGYITVILLVFRLTWGLFGSEYSRLETFTFSPVHILEHMKELVTLRPVRHYIGHNPTGSIMVFGLLFVLATITLSGLLVLGGEENQGPLAGAASYAVGDMAADVHNAFVILLAVMIVAHVGGVYAEIKLTGENLVKSMISGLKKVPAGTPQMAHRDARPLAAITVMGAFVALAGSMLWVFSTMPPSGLLTLPANDAYESIIQHLPVNRLQICEHRHIESSLSHRTGLLQLLTGINTVQGIVSDRFPLDQGNDFTLLELFTFNDRQGCQLMVAVTEAGNDSLQISLRQRL